MSWFWVFPAAKQLAFLQRNRWSGQGIFTARFFPGKIRKRRPGKRRTRKRKKRKKTAGIGTGMEMKAKAAKRTRKI